MIYQISSRDARILPRKSPHVAHREFGELASVGDPGSVRIDKENRGQCLSLDKIQSLKPHPFKIVISFVELSVRHREHVHVE